MLIYAICSEKYMTAEDAQPSFHFSSFVQPAAMYFLYASDPSLS